MPIKARSTALTLLFSAGLSLLSGCGLQGPGAGAGAGMTPPVMGLQSGGSGRAQGGNVPIAGASIQLYAMGMSGYGSAATLYATTTTSNDGYGSFAFSKSTSLTGPTAPTTPNYGCPASGDPQMYLTASGGNTQGIGSSNNTAVRYAVAIGPCSGITAATYVNMNEVTNVATMAALAQFFNPVTESFGAPASTQAYAALVNAVATVNILANVAAGTANPVVTPGSNVAGVSIQATPEYQKVNTLANILASCVNTTAATSQTCSALFAAAVPPAPAVTNQPLATFTAATDTLQAAYYLLTNPASSGSANIAALFGLTVATPPFQPQLSAAPTDWTIGISYDAGGSTCGPTSGGFISSPVTVAVDGNGMVWIGNGQSSIGNLTAMTPTGGAMVCALGTIDSSTAGAVLDANNNVYVASHAAGSAAITRTDNTGKNATTITTAGPVASIAADAVGDVYFVTDATSTVYKIPAGSTSPASVGASSGGMQAIALDNGQNVYYAGGAAAKLGYYNLTTTTGTSNFYATPATLSAGAGNSVASVAVGSGGVAWALVNNSSGSELIPFTGGVAGTATASGAGGLSTPRAAVADGAGNLWVANNSANTSGMWSVSEFTASGASITPDGGNGGFQKTAFSYGRGIAVDPSGNVWVTTGSTANAGGTALVEVVGAAVPLIAPAAAGAANPPAQFKNKIAGLIDMGDVTFHNTDSGTPTSTAAADFATHQGIFGGYVINVTWGQLQPTSTTVVTHPNVIDDALTQLRAYNAANPTAPLVGKLRVWQGANAPGWAKALNGGPLSIVRNSTGGTITVGLYWSAPYIAAWRTLQQQLAALYDSEPLIAGVHMTSCSAQGDEPLVATSDAASSTTLYNAGLTDASFQACLNGFPQDYSAWKQTPIVFTFNPYQDRDGPQQIPPTGNVLEPWVTFRLMETCRTVLGNRCYLENHELNCPGSTSVAFIYDELRALGPPINLQTMSPAQLPTDWTSVLNSGINTGASGVELWLNYGGFATMQNTTLQGYANLFAGSGVACP